MNGDELNRQLAGQQREYPIRSENRVVEVSKLENGALHCVQASGNEFTLPAEEKEMQVFVIRSMIAGGF